MRLTLLLSLFVFTACGMKSPLSSSYIMGKTTRADVVAEMGEPISEEVLPMADSRIIKYKKNNENFQLKGEIVVTRFTDPEDEQSKLIWWKHKFKDCSPVVRQLPREVGSHTPPEMEMTCLAEGTSIIYTDGSDAVSRVVEFEKK